MTAERVPSDTMQPSAPTLDDTEDETLDIEFERLWIEHHLTRQRADIGTVVTLGRVFVTLRMTADQRAVCRGHAADDADGYGRDVDVHEEELALAGAARRVVARIDAAETTAAPRHRQAPAASVSGLADG